MNDVKYKIKVMKSPLWKLLKVIFKGIDLGETWATFGSTIWTPGYLPKDVLAHELVHIEQQRNCVRAIGWWIRYLTSKEFRYEQELPAFRAQLRFAKRAFPNRNEWPMMRMRAAKDLSGSKYGNTVDYQKAFHDLYFDKNNGK
jgi:hypothetical protein